MFSFSDNIWHLVAGTLVFLLGLSFAYVQKDIFQIKTRTASFLYFWHTAFSIYYFLYSLSNPADAAGYFYKSLLPLNDFSFGSSAVTHLTSIFSSGMNFSYGVTFLVFNIFGYIGMIALYSAMQAQVYEKSKNAQRLLFLTICLPGLSFWSSSIGKDSITFMASGLMCWSMLDLKNRFLVVLFAVAAYIFVRPHSAAILILSIAFSLLFYRKINFFKRIGALALIAPVAVVSVTMAIAYAGFEGGIEQNAIEDYVERRQGYNQEGGGAIDISSMSIGGRIFAYLFRPLFFDASGIIGLAASMENFFLLMLFVWLGKRWIVRKSNCVTHSFVFYLSYGLLSLAVLANTTSNLGIALRQKWMFLPMLLVFIFSVAYGRPRRAPSSKTPSRWSGV